MTRMPLPRVLVLTVYLSFAPAIALAAQPTIDFAREIQPLLAQHCLDCHGHEKPKGGLQLTRRATALKGGESGEPAIVPGDSAKSGLIKRLTTTDDNDVMPQKADRLPAAVIAKLKRWIDEGAVWPDDVKHWAYEKPTRPALPTLPPALASRALNPIDAFVLARLPAGLAPAPATDKPRWLRRVSLDLIGLPPTPAELAAFLADDSPRAFETVVDRLLASPRYGERWARPWLDLARYADSHGFQRDDLRDLWPYRDWVIRALNADLPFDRFTIWQIAGDLLPAAERPADAPLDPLVATGFHRSVPTNVEAGTDQEEGRVNQVFDRVNTTASVWLGTTLECAQCHNHKYDPFSQKDYYRLFAYFNSTPVETAFATPKAMATLKFTGPYLAVPDPEKEKLRPALEARVAELDRQIAAGRTAALARQPDRERAATLAVVSAGQSHPLEIAAFESAGESNYRILPDGSVLLVDDAPDRDTYTITVKTALAGITGFKLEALADPSLPGGGPGRGDAERPNFVLNRFAASVAVGGAAPQPVAFARASASFAQPRFEPGLTLRAKTDNRTGWAIASQFFRSHWAVFETERPVGSADGATFTFTLVQNFGAGRTIGRVRLSALTGPVQGPKLPADVIAALQTPASARTAAQTARLNEHFLDSDPALVALRSARAKAEQDIAALRGSQTLVLQELPQPRATHVLRRGSFLDPAEPVEPGTPAALHAAPAAGAMRSNRLDLARWLVSPDNPLVARVTVNRWWAEFFGRGIVATPEDFGAKGEPPTHPELLDWLAIEFMAHGWSAKHVHKLIALSGTYRQAARLTPAALELDPENKWLARGPRFRLDAETIRDNALAVAGLLSPRMFGPPVRPYQPPGLWENKVGGDRVTYTVSAGEDAHRRGLYTVLKRASPYPSFMNFDATARTACTIKRSRSNTPLQALTLLNDPVYVEAAAALARRVLAELLDASTDERLRHAFQLCLTRPPTAPELEVLRAHLAADASAPAPAAWQSVAAVLLNLDETITK